MYEEGEDQVKSLCPLWTGLYIWYNGFYNKKLEVMFWLNLKITLVQIKACNLALWRWNS